MEDRNFDDLAMRFKRNVYGTLKGRIRLAILERDFAESLAQLYAPNPPLDILDLGAGQAPFSLQFANCGHRLVLTDISSNMLNEAELALTNGDPDVRQRVHFLHAPLQKLAEPLARAGLPGKFDMVICHAVIEWLADPQSLYDYISRYLKPGGFVSLTFYNINGLAFKNLLRTNFHKFDIDNFTSFRGSLTPTHPQEPQTVLRELDARGFMLKAKSGIRVFHDYILNPEDRNREPDAVVTKELAYSRREPFWQMARYIHFIAQLAP